MEVKAVDADAIFKVFTACSNDPKTLLLDVREHKQFKKGHINQAFNPRLATNGKFLADYSQAQFSMPWSQDCWWGKPVIVYGPPSLSKEHPVIKFLAEQQRCASVSYYKQGYDAFAQKYPFLATTSVKANSFKKYPSMIVPGFLFLGDWGDAEQQERLKELKVKRVVTIHNHPDRLKLPAGVKHLKIEMADISSADISPHFNAVYEFLAEAERLKHPVLVHCGAGVSRSACLVMMFLMRSRRWSAQKAREHCIAARSLVCPNDGFWRLLCALEGPLGILERSDPNDTMGFAGADAPAVKLDAQAAGQPVQVRMLSPKEVKLAQEAKEKAAALAAAAAAAEQAERRQQEQQQRQQQEQQQQQERQQQQQGQQQPLARGDAQGSSGRQAGQEPASRKRSRSRGSSDDSNSSSSSSSSSGSDSSSSSGSDSSSDSGSSRERPKKLQRPAKAPEQRQALRRPRSRSRSRDRSRSRSRSRDRSRGRHALGSRQEHHNGAAGRSRGRSPHRRRSRSRSRDQQQRVGSGSNVGSHAGGLGGQEAPAAAPSAAGAALPAGLPEPPPQERGWLVKMEVSKPEGLVGHLLLGPWNTSGSQRVVFGRAPACDIVLEHASISRQHAQLSVDVSGVVFLMDLGSQHGTKLNDSWIKGKQNRTMSPGSTVQFGASTRRYKLLEVQQV